MTPKTIKAEAIAWYREMEEIGLVENADLFKEYLIVEINAGNPNRLDIYLPPDLMNQFLTMGAQIGFRV